MALGCIGAQLFFQGNDYSQHLGVDELYASMNASASAPAVQAQLASISLGLHSRIRRFSARPSTPAPRGVSLGGLDSEGAFFFSYFMVTDRRYMYVEHVQQFSYRDLLSTNAPLIVLAVGILLASLLLEGSLLFRRLQTRSCTTPSSSRFAAPPRGSGGGHGDAAQPLGKDYAAVQILGKGKHKCVVRATWLHSGEQVTSSWRRRGAELAPQRGVGPPQTTRASKLRGWPGSARSTCRPAGCHGVLVRAGAAAGGRGWARPTCRGWAGPLLQARRLRVGRRGGPGARA